STRASLVVLRNPVSIPVLQHVQRPGALHRGVSVVVLVQAEFQHAATPAMPTEVPGAVVILRIEHALDPAAADQVRPPRAEDCGIALVVGIVNPEVPEGVVRNPFGYGVDGGVQLRGGTIETAIDVERDQLEM